MLMHVNTHRHTINIKPPITYMLVLATMMPTIANIKPTKATNSKIIFRIVIGFILCKKEISYDIFD